MSAFSELGVAPELVTAVSEMGWTLPTPIQDEAIPLILGGGDVLAAAETGTGKTGAFGLPVVQIVAESKAETLKPAVKLPLSDLVTTHTPVSLSDTDRDNILAVSENGLVAQARHQHRWGGGRCVVGALKGKVYYEAVVRDEGLCRVGFSTMEAVRDLGTDAYSFGYGGTGKKSNRKQFDNYGEAFGLGDVIGCLLDLDGRTIRFSKNGVDLGQAFTIGDHVKDKALYPAVVLKNAEIGFTFNKPFKCQPDGFVGIGELTVGQSSLSVSASTVVRSKNAPLAVILEPTRDLAEQTDNEMSRFKSKLNVATACFTGGGGQEQRKIDQSLRSGVDIITATPGRLIDLVDGGRVVLSHVRFIVLDEADRLLDTGNRDMILKMYNAVPKTTRTQVLLFSATLHSRAVSSLSEQITRFASWIDLKGKDSVPDTVDHVITQIAPRQDRSWLGRSSGDEGWIQTDGMHSNDATGSGGSSEALSEAIKLLKPRALLNIIDHYNMDQGIVFCRTKPDCDNLEEYLIKMGGGTRYGTGGIEGKYSCVVLHGDRNQGERRGNLDAFKAGAVKFLICTDVAARGIDIAGLPYCINITLPDNVEDYIHRTGRVGRAEVTGLAISIVGKEEEKVWYHGCSKGWKCQNRQLKERGGCAIWYNEQQILGDIQTRLGFDIPELNLGVSTIEQVYGRARTDVHTVETSKHVDELKPVVMGLMETEQRVQDMYWSLKLRINK